MTTTPDLLATIVAATRRAVEYRESVCSIAALERQTSREPRGTAFVEALRTSPSPRVIAECKRRSPSKGILRENYDPAAHARSYAEAGAAAISVLTEPTFFDGALAHLRAVREGVSIPVLRKDFIVTRYQVHEAAAHGADAILLILGALDDDTFHDLLTLAMSLGLAVLSEVHDSAELDRAFTKGANLIGVNSRNLRTLTVDHDVLEDVARVFGTPGSLFVAESGIRTAADMARLRTLGYHAFLVGERLITQPDPGAALRELRRS